MEKRGAPQSSQQGLSHLAPALRSSQLVHGSSDVFVLVHSSYSDRGKSELSLGHVSETLPGLSVVLPSYSEMEAQYPHLTQKAFPSTMGQPT